jgi:hypothetical protein
MYTFLYTCPYSLCFIVTAMNPSTLSCLRSEWRALGSSSASSTAYCRLAGLEPVIAEVRASNLAELVVALRSSSDLLSADKAAAIVGAMVHSAGVDPLIPRAIVQALLPGLCALPRRVDTRAVPWSGDLDAFFADALSFLWEQITRWSGTERAYAAGDLLSRVRWRLVRLQSTERPHHEHQVALPGGLETIHSVASRSGPELLASAIIEAMEAGLEPVAAVALYGTRVLGLSLTELAARTGTSRATLTRHRDRAIAVLAA